MTQTSSSDQLMAPSQLSAVDGSAQMADSYAEQLMDELFEDVDQILDGRSTPPLPPVDPTSLTAPANAPATPFTANSRPFDAATVTLPAMLVPVETTSDDTESDLDEADNQTPSRRQAFVQWLPRLVLGAACMSVLVAFGFWLAKQQSPSPAPAAATTTEGVETAQTPSDEAAFGEYLLRSLNILNGQTRAQQETATTALPTNNNGNPATTTAAQQPNIIERVFVPVFQPNTSTGASLPTPQLQATTPAPTTAAPAPTSPTAAAPAPNTTAAAPIPNIAPASTHALVGVLELGNRSAALFEINGVPQRVYVGETVGSSGWSVVSVANQEVIVRRNGEVRSIRIGQQF